MMSNLNFSDVKYKEKALKINYNNMNVCSYVDSVFILINGLDYECLSILCDKMYEEFSIYGNSYVTKIQCYEMTQNLYLNYELKEMIVNLFNKCIDSGMYLGTRMSSIYNSSSWINHSYYVGECCMNLALILGLDSNKARSYGMLHDYGRKKGFTFNHVIDGFEELTELGYCDSAVACLTHSFLNGGRCANNEKAVSGFYVDKDGNPRWVEGTNLDDITSFLDNYQYNDYDMILNIADLMATEKGIVSPYDRIVDIATRREIDPVNRAYFLASLTNTLIYILKRINLIAEDTEYIIANENTSLVQIETRFKQISDYFYTIYMQLSAEKKNVKI